VYNGLKAIHELGSLGGLLYPLTSVLEQETHDVELGPFIYTYDSGVKVVRSRNLGKINGSELYPSKLWSPSVLPSWTNKPGGSPENPPTIAYMTVAYPSFFVDDSTANPLSNGQIRAGGDWPFKKSPGTNLPEQPGNAVDNSVDLLSNIGNTNLPDWNLDADRGLSFLTWIFKPTTSPLDDPVTIQPE
jgi:hypothetical protein